MRKGRVVVMRNKSFGKMWNVAMRVGVVSVFVSRGAIV